MNSFLCFLVPALKSICFTNSVQHTKFELINPRNLLQLLLESFKNLLGTLLVVFHDPLSIVN